MPIAALMGMPGWFWSAGAVGLLLAAAMFVLSNVLLVIVLVALPVDFFSRPATRVFGGDRHPVLAVAILIAKNVVGTVVILTGIVLALPGVPGPGTLLIVVGLALVDFPGKRRLEARLAGHERVLGAINAMRARFGRPPLLPPPKHHDQRTR